MSNIDIRAIAPAGYVRACFSKRLGGHCLPLGLVRAHLGVVNCGAVRRRLSREFAGYLVTEPAVVDFPFPPFSVRRWWHESGLYPTTGDWFRPWDFLAWVGDDDKGALDSPDFIALGSFVPLVVLRSGFVVSGPSTFSRGGL